jgi:putative chitinase
MTLAVSQVSQMLPRNREPQEWTPILNEFLQKYNINTINRIAGFVAQTAHESLDYTILEENLNYSWQALRRTWPRHFPTDDIAKQYHRRPQAIANRAYANRMSNGSEESGDGWRFRGRGIIQLTGRQNYTNFGRSIGLTAEEVADYLTSKRGSLESACWFWNVNNINRFCDTNDIVGMTRAINGGTIGLNDRTVKYSKFREILAQASNDSTNTFISVGSKGTIVANIQRALGIGADGIFGPMTENAVKRWQTSQNFPSTGKINQQQYEILVRNV